MKGRTPARNATERPCAVCAQVFQPYRDRQRVCSRRCYAQLPDIHARIRAWSDRLEAKERKNAARRIVNNPGRREINRRSLLARYGLTIDQWDAMFTAQGGVCAICGRTADPNGVRAASRLHIDHDHETGHNRGLLCNNCNRGVGYFNDDAERIRAAARYLDRY